MTEQEAIAAVERAARAVAHPPGEFHRIVLPDGTRYVAEGVLDRLRLALADLDRARGGDAS